MSRFLAAVTMVVMAAMATSNYWCTLCDPAPAETTQTAHCHGSKASSGDDRLSAAHDCSEHSSPEIVASARTESPVILIADLSRVQIASLSDQPHTYPSFDVGVLANHPKPRAIALRI